MAVAIDISNPIVLSRPFPCFIKPSALDERAADPIRTWLRTCPAWQKVDGTFYRLDEMRLTRERLPAELGWLVGEQTVHSLRACMAAAFGARLDPHVTLDAHRMGPGQLVRIHNDAKQGDATHRLVLGLAASWEEDDGGELLLFGGPRVEDVEVAVAPADGVAVGFEISERSYHGVAPVGRPDRLTLVYSFRRFD